METVGVFYADVVLAILSRLLQIGINGNVLAICFRGVTRSLSRLLQIGINGNELGFASTSTLAFPITSNRN